MRKRLSYLTGPAENGGHVVGREGSGLRGSRRALQNLRVDHLVDVDHVVDNLWREVLGPLLRRLHRLLDLYHPGVRQAYAAQCAVVGEESLAG